MEMWKWISLQSLKKVSKEQLLPNQRYIMYSTTKFWPNSRRLVTFVRLSGENHVVVDVKDIQLFAPIYTKKSVTFLSPDDNKTNKYWSGNNKTIQASGFDFYEYPENIESILETKKRSEISQSIRSHIPSLEQLSRSVVSEHHGISMDELNKEIPTKYIIQRKTKRPTRFTMKSGGGKTKKHRKSTRSKRIKV